VTGRSVAGLAVGVLLVAMTTALAVTTARLLNRTGELDRARIDAAAQRVATAQAKVETVTVKLHAARDTLTRTIHTVRVETLTVAPITRADTVRALGEFKALVVQHDSLQRKCSAFEITCEEYRLSAEQRDSARQHEIAVLRDVAKHAQPGRLRRTWESVDQWVFLGGGICIGAALAGHSCLP
jgi:hypothetical protein